MNVLHPPFVHFIVALPVAALFSQLTYLATDDRTYSKAAFRIIAFTLLMGLFALYTGMSDAERVVKSGAILSTGLNVLGAHKTFGFIVVGIIAITTLAKWIAVSKGSRRVEKLSLLLIILTILTSLYQGNQGGSLVYKNGAAIDNKIIQKRMEQLKNGSTRP